MNPLNALKEIKLKQKLSIFPDFFFTYNTDESMHEKHPFPWEKGMCGKIMASKRKYHFYNF